MKENERPRSGNDAVHRRLHQMQFSAVGGAHKYSSLSLINLGNNRLNRLAWSSDVRLRAPVSYDRIMAMQPLPSTARDLSSRASAIQGPSIEAAIHRFVIADQISSWKSFADHHSKSRNRLSMQPKPRHDSAVSGEELARLSCAENAAKPAAEKEIGQRHLRVVRGHQDNLPKNVVVSGSSRSMFDVLRRRQTTTLNSEAPASNGSEPGGATCVKRRTNMMKKKEMLEARDRKRRATRYILPEGSALVASDQSALAARNSIVLTALEEKDEREREEVRRRLWKLIKIEGAVTEEMKVMAREALSSGDMEAALKIINEAESQVERLEASRAPSVAGNRPLSLRSFSSDTSFVPDRPDTDLKSPPRSPLRPSTARHFHDSEGGKDGKRGRKRPATARAYIHHGALRWDTSRPAGEHVCSSRTVSPVIGEVLSVVAHRDQTTFEEVGVSGGDVEKHLRLVDSDCEVGLQDSEVNVPETFGASEQEEADDKKAKHKIRSEKQRQMANWLRLADEQTECDSVSFDRVDLDYRRLSELPEWFLAPELRVRVVSLRKNNIPSIPDSFCSQLPFLEECDLSYNMLSCLPQTFGSLSNLKKLFLNENRLQGLPFSLGSLTKLQLLNIEKNSITRLPCSLLTVGGTLKTLLTRGNPTFCQPPQSLIDDESLLGIREYLAAVFTAGKASREQVWKELDARGMPVPALLMAIACKEIAPDWEQKKAGRPADPTFSKGQFEEKVRWELKLLKDSDSCKALWEFLDQDGNGQLSHRQFLYQMKRPMRSASVGISAVVVENAEDQSGVIEASHASAPIGKLEITSLLGSHLPAIETYCTITFGAQHAMTNVVKQTPAPRWTFPGPSVTPLELEYVEFSVNSLSSMPSMQIDVFAGATEVGRAHEFVDVRSTDEANKIGEVDICADDLIDIMSSGTEESELVYDIFMHETETADSAVEENAHRRRLHGTDGSPATIIVKLKPFVFEVDGRTDALQHSRRIKHGLQHWIKHASHHVAVQKDAQQQDPLGEQDIA